MTFISSDAILLVEDDRVLRLLTVGLLEEADYWVFDAKNAETPGASFRINGPSLTC